MQSGTYKENVNVTKQLILRGVDTGAGKPVVDAGGSGSAITLSADGITLEGFEARNSGKKSGDAGIKATSDNNVIKNNNVSLNNKGIYLIYSSNNSIISNNISKNYFGIVLSDSNNNTISGNNINNNNEFHIYNSNTIKNTTYNSSIVICVYPEGVGLLLLDSDHNIIYLNNFINNLYNTANCFSTNLIWNSTKKINYTYRNTTYINYLGNYWSDYTGTDADDDGIGDTPHGGDNYPLMERFENYFPEENQQPIAYFTYSPLNSVVNQTITFNASLSYDIDGNIILYEWKFGDNTTKEGVIVTHSYLKAGSYTVTLTVKDNFGEKNSTSKMVSVKANLIKNGDFSDGLNNWTERGYGRGNRQVKVVYDDAINSSVLEFKRWNSGADGGMVGVYQNLSINVNEYKEIYLEADVKVISNTLGDSGWWSYVYGGDGEFPVHLYLYYEDENGTDWVWTHGFLPVKDYWNRTNYDIVNRSEWYHYISPNLVFLKTTTTKPHNVPIPSPPPKKITGIFLGGKCWDFSGRIDNVKLNIKAEDTTPPSSITNLQSTAGLTWINWT
ncbi:MAG: NosD domain-containing protein, partial [Methanosarcinales archaeon]